MKPARYCQVKGMDYIIEVEIRYYHVQDMSGEIAEMCHGIDCGIRMDMRCTRNKGSNRHPRELN